MIRVNAQYDVEQTVEAVREALLDCRKQGTHYSLEFIERIYERVKEGAR